MHNFRELKIWQKSRSLVKEVYSITSDFPNEELYGLINQIRRSVVSIPSNIAEGCGRATDSELARFLDIANASAFELETQLILAADLAYLSNEACESLVKNIQGIEKMIYSFKLMIQKSQVSV